MESGLDTRVQVVAVIATVLALLLVLELVRRRRLVERYALLWMTAAAALVVLAVWRDALEVIADLIGVADPANAIFLLAFAVVLTLLLHFSIATSRLSDEAKILAQEVARLDQELRALRAGRANGDAPATADTKDAEDAAVSAPEAAPGPAPSSREGRG